MNKSLHGQNLEISAIEQTNSWIADQAKLNAIAMSLNESGNIIYINYKVSSFLIPIGFAIRPWLVLQSNHGELQ